MSLFMNNQDIELLKKFIGAEIDLLLERQVDSESANVFEFKYKTELIESFIQGLVKAEFEMFLRGSKDKNYKNGKKSRSINTADGQIDIDIPRDRKGNYYPSFITKYSTCTEDLSKMITSLFRLGMSNKDIVTFLEEHIQVTYSRASIGNLTNCLDIEIDNFKSRQLKSEYFAVFIDATYIPVKIENEYNKTAVYIMVGVTPEGHQEILSYYIGYSEMNHIWAEMFDDIKSRGVEHIQIITSDGMVGIEQVIKTRFPNADIQRCVFHVLKNIKSKTPPSVRYEILNDFSNLFKLTDKEAFSNQKNHLYRKWAKYEKLLRTSCDADYVATYLNYPSGIQRLIKTSNRVEAVNQKIKTRISFKRVFPSVESLEQSLVASLIEQNFRSSKILHGMKDYIRYLHEYKKDVKKDGN